MLATLDVLDRITKITKSYDNNFIEIVHPHIILFINKLWFSINVLWEMILRVCPNKGAQ